MNAAHEKSFDALRRYMSALCRDAWDVTWTDHLEYSLWHALIHGPMRMGRLELGQAHLDELRRLSEACDGWVWVDRSGAVQGLPRNAWQDIYASNVDVLHMNDPIPPPLDPGRADG